MTPIKSGTQTAFVPTYSQKITDIKNCVSSKITKVVNAVCSVVYRIFDTLKSCFQAVVTGATRLKNKVCSPFQKAGNNSPSTIPLPNNMPGTGGAGGKGSSSGVGGGQESEVSEESSIQSDEENFGLTRDEQKLLIEHLKNVVLGRLNLGDTEDGGKLKKAFLESTIFDDIISELEDGNSEFLKGDNHFTYTLKDLADLFEESSQSEIKKALDDAYGKDKEYTLTLGLGENNGLATNGFVFEISEKSVQSRVPVPFSHESSELTKDEKKTLIERLENVVLDKLNLGDTGVAENLKKVFLKSAIFDDIFEDSEFILGNQLYAYTLKDLADLFEESSQSEIKAALNNAYGSDENYRLTIKLDQTNTYNSNGCAFEICEESTLSRTPVPISRAFNSSDKFTRTDLTTEEQNALIERLKKAAFAMLDLSGIANVEELKTAFFASTLFDEVLGLLQDTNSNFMKGDLELSYTLEDFGKFFKDRSEGDSSINLQLETELNKAHNVLKDYVFKFVLDSSKTIDKGEYVFEIREAVGRNQTAQPISRSSLIEKNEVAGATFARLTEDEQDMLIKHLKDTAFNKLQFQGADDVDVLRIEFLDNALFEELCIDLKSEDSKILLGRTLFTCSLEGLGRFFENKIGQGSILPSDTIFKNALFAAHNTSPNYKVTFRLDENEKSDCVFIICQQEESQETVTKISRAGVVT